MLAQRAERLRESPLAMLLRPDPGNEIEDTNRATELQERLDQRDYAEKKASLESKRRDGHGSAFQTILRITPVVEGIGEVQAGGSAIVVLFSRIKRNDDAPVSIRSVHGNGFGITESEEDNITR
jgi:hypothetical protein